jgi:hypothetical protein
MPAPPSIGDFFDQCNSLAKRAGGSRRACADGSAAKEKQIKYLGHIVR